MRALMLLCLAGGLVVAAPDTPTDPAATCDTLAPARKEIRLARFEFKRLARVEQTALRQAREVVFSKTERGKALAPGFGAAADLLEVASKQDKDLEKLCTEMAASFRAMAAALDKKAGYLTPEQQAQPPAKRADATFKTAHGMLTAAAKSKAPEDDVARARALVRKGDPRHRALAKNMQVLGVALKAAEGSQPTDAVKATLARVRQLTDLLAAQFAGVATERPKPPPAPAPT
ncbi:MAG: hypothetical protein ACYTGI_00015 [Planctomycetota bacterium]|jgi:hypothetical protein